jgi:hypothetical protein
MKKRIIGIIGIAIIIVVLLIIAVYCSKNSLNQKLPDKVNNVETSKLVKIAGDFILTKPNISIENSKIVSWSEEETTLNYTIDPAWLTNHQPTVQYFAPDRKDLGEFYSYLKGKYVIGWFFIPECEENPKSKNSPNWFDKEGYPCLGGYDLQVLLDNNLAPERVIMLALD